MYTLLWIWYNFHYKSCVAHRPNYTIFSVLDIGIMFHIKENLKENVNEVGIYTFNYKGKNK